MVDKTDFLLNLLVVVSTGVVMFLMYDSTDVMLSPILALQQDAEVSVNVLSENCGSAWKKAKPNSNAGADKDWHSNLGSKPRYADEGFCGRLPADISAAHLWNEHLQWILEASSNEQEIASHVITSKLLHFLTPSKYLELGHRSRPSRREWGRLLDKIDARMKGKGPIVNIAAFGAGSVDCDLNEPGKEATDEQMRDDFDCMWPVRLEVFLNNMLNHGRPKLERKAIVNIYPMYAPDLAVTTEFYTEVIRHELWSERMKEAGGVDVILTAFNAQDNFTPKRGLNAAEDIDYYDHKRKVIQEHIRTSLETRQCTSTRQEPPIQINVDGYVGNGLVMAENVQARVMQQLSDYYETAFVSYAEVIRKLVYASDDNRSPLLHTSLKDWTGDWQHSVNAKQKDTKMIEHGFLGPIAMTLTLAFSFLRYTVSHCEDKVNSKPDYAIVSEEVFKLTEEVPPPELNTDLCLTNVSSLWQLEKSKQAERDDFCRQNPYRQPQMCSFAFWGATHKSREELESYLRKYCPSDGRVGWDADRGRLVATQSGAALSFRFKSVRPELTNWKIKIFSAYEDSAASFRSKLQWKLSSGVDAEGTATGIIEGTHDSPTTVVLPTIIPVDQSLLAGELKLDLNLIEGDRFEILAMMLCNESDK